ncbi:MAG: hypothetical protein GEU73_08945 [Chloroflexi bacterium]|nr:hypothetical protein [Chloroflexota bacterium]
MMERETSVQEEAMAVTGRMVRAISGEVALFEEVERDTDATAEALIVVAIVAVAGGLSSGLAPILAGNPGAALGGLVVGVVSSLVGWAVFAGIAYFIGTRLFSAIATWGETLRTLGYAYSAGVFSVFGFIPIVGPLIALAAYLWFLYLVFVALRSALDITGPQTIGTILLSIIPTLIIVAVVTVPLAPLMPTG